MPTDYITFQNSAGHSLSGILRQPDQVEPKKLPAIIVVHGFNENMNRDWILDIANFISPYGFVALRFDFHGHGESEGDFEEHTVTQQIDDVKSAVDFVEQLSEVDSTKIFLIGHDIGGDISVLAAAEDARVKGVISWAARGDIEKHITSRMADYELDELKQKGRYAHGQFDINSEYLEDLKEHNVQEAFNKLQVPILLIHGRDDLQIRVDEARKLLTMAHEPKQLVLIPEADHWCRQPEAREFLLETMLNWLKRSV